MLEYGGIDAKDYVPGAEVLKSTEDMADDDGGTLVIRLTGQAR